jgi:hypothetical protein
MRLTSQQLRQFAKAGYLFLPECPRLVWAGKDIRAALSRRRSTAVSAAKGG